MRVLLTLTAVAVLITSIAYALPARCENCLSGFDCWSNTQCGGSGCSCLRINGLGNPGVCG
jgi:hypothetical protein